MSTQKNAIQKSDLIYFIYKSVPTDGRDGELLIHIQHKTKDKCDALTITWGCKLYNTENSVWENANLRYEHKDFSTLPLINQLENLGFTEKSTFEQILDMIYQNEIEQGLLTEVKDEEEQAAYAGFLSESEIKAGSFIRNGDRMKFILPKEKQKQLIEELEYAKITNINLLLKITE